MKVHTGESTLLLRSLAGFFSQKSAFYGVADGQDVHVRAGIGSQVDPEGPDQHKIT